MKEMIIVSNVNGTAHIVIPSENTRKFLDMLDEAAKRYPDLGNSYTVYQVNKVPLEALPIEIQEKVKSTLKAYNSCNVYFEYNEFHASASVGIKSNYNYDHFVCGRYLAKEVYTEEERRQNYIESFGYAPTR